MTVYRHDDWNQLIGAFVEVRRNDAVLRSGFVDDVMPDSSALWLASDACHPRTLIEKAEGFDVWVAPHQLQGTLKYRMTATALHPGSAAAESRERRH